MSQSISAPSQPNFRQTGPSSRPFVFSSSALTCEKHRRPVVDRLDDQCIRQAKRYVLGSATGTMLKPWRPATVIVTQDAGQKIYCGNMTDTIIAFIPVCLRTVL